MRHAKEMTINHYLLSTGEVIIEVDFDGQRYKTIVVPKARAWQREHIVSWVQMQWNTYGKPGAVEMVDHYKESFGYHSQEQKRKAVA